MELRIKSRISTLLCVLLTLTACAPATNIDPLTGKAIGAVGGAAAGAGIAAVLKSAPPGIVVGGVLGGGLGYYMTTLRFASSGIVKIGGRVYTLGQYLIIEIPTDNLFEANTDEYLPDREIVLSSITAVLERYRKNSNIFISGNTSGFSTVRFEHEISQKRAEKVAFYLWAHGFNDQTGRYSGLYVGYGNRYPLANDLHIKGIRYNSNIQIIAFPCQEDLHWDAKTRQHFTKYKDEQVVVHDPLEAPSLAADPNQEYGDAFSDDHTPEAPAPAYNPRVSGSTPPLNNTGYEAELKGEFSDATPPPSNYNNTSSASQTNFASNDKKHWGYKGDNDLKDETPFSAPTPA
jgi:outer membrane protein OmpA-like peptidoglycan-associated protein